MSATTKTPAEQLERANRAVLLWSQTPRNQYSTELCDMLGESLRAALEQLDAASGAAPAAARPATRGELATLPILPWAVFDEHGDPADDRVQDYGLTCWRAAVAAIRAGIYGEALAAAAAQAAPAAQPQPPKRFRVKKEAGAAFARVVDTEEGREVKRFNVVRRPDDWEAAERLCKRLNQQHEAGAAGATGETA